MLKFAARRSDRKSRRYIAVRWALMRVRLSKMRWKKVRRSTGWSGGGRARSGALLQLSQTVDIRWLNEIQRNIIAKMILGL